MAILAPIEAMLGAAKFLNNCRIGHTCSCALRRLALEKLPHWTWEADVTSKASETWWATLHKVQARLEEHGKLPIQRSSLGKWLHNQKSRM